GSGPAPKPTGEASSGIRQAAKAAGQGQQDGENKGQAQAQPAPAPASADSSSGGGSGRAIASAAMRTAGVLSAISVPGMEGAAGLSLGPQP
ncbi:P-type conjugative transfer protein TrbL, partial [Escherichia coli]|nr:P-type conjugative transfer protein TrbL [Escherichia coli]